MDNGVIEFRAVRIHRGGLRSRQRAVVATSPSSGLYLGLISAQLSIGSVMIFNGDILVRRRIWAFSEPIYVYRSAMKTLYSTASGSLATAVLSLAASDPAVREALSLGRAEALTWPRIYDIIEFLRGPRSIAKSGLASMTKTDCMKQTANYYRHLGNPKDDKLPSNPPTLRAASLFAADILQQWIARKQILAAIQHLIDTAKAYPVVPGSPI